MRFELLISGMLAVHAKHAVFAALGGVAGVTRAEVELGRVELEVARPEAELAAVESELRAAVEAVGFTVTDVRRLARQLPTL
jgi:copper chaperone CopZ